MGKKAKELGALAVSKLSKSGWWAVGGVSGLTLQVLPSGSKSWLLRYSVGTKRRAMGLGCVGDVTLSGAREAARDARAKIKAGMDPIGERRALRSAVIAAQAKEKTFKHCAEGYIKAHEAEWSAKHANQYATTLETYAYPAIGNMLVGDIELAHVVNVLEPIWKLKTVTATRVQNRVESVLDYATAKGYRKGDNPAKWDLLKSLLEKPSKIKTVKHHAALPVTEVGPFMAALREAKGIKARAVEFLVLTAARSGEVCGAVWAEIDLEAKTWTLPGNRMKAGKLHRVPLSTAAVKLLSALPQGADADFVFPLEKGGELTDSHLLRFLKSMGRNDITVHGMRAAFKTFASEKTNFQREVVEVSLAHAVGDAVEAAYNRGDLLEKRRKLMEAWSSWCANSERGNVVLMKAKVQL